MSKRRRDYSVRRRGETSPVSVGQIVLSCNRIRIELSHADYPQEPLWLTLEERSGRLLGGIQEPGWLKHLQEMCHQRGMLLEAPHSRGIHPQVPGLSHHVCQ